MLTDGGMYYSKAGDVLKKFHTRDGMGITLLRQKNIFTILVTKEKTLIVKQWARKMKIKKLYDGVVKKDLVLSKVCKNFGIKKDQIAYIGDDVNDIPLLKKVGFSAAPRDATVEVQKISDYVCNNKGGEGVLREVADLILSVKTK